MTNYVTQILTCITDALTAFLATEPGLYISSVLILAITTRILLSFLPDGRRSK